MFFRSKKTRASDIIATDLMKIGGVPYRVVSTEQSLLNLTRRSVNLVTIDVENDDTDEVTTLYVSGAQKFRVTKNKH